MKKRAASVILALILIICVLPLNAEAGTLSNFTKTRTYTAGQFSDVSNQWYAADVKTAYEYNLVQGTSTNTYSPGNNLTIAEAITLASTMHSTYNTGASSFSKGTPWYQPYVDYALVNGIIQSPYPNYSANATRSDMAVIFATVLPDEALTPINKIEDGSIPDVSVTYTYGTAVYKLYRAGILSGSGDNHAFSPNNSITRAEVAAIVARMASSNNRVAFTISSKELSKLEIAAKCTPAVFYIEVYDQAGKLLGNASGFFVSSSGLAVTNFHVIEGASSAKIKLKDIKTNVLMTYDVAGVYDYSKTNDLALLQINGSGFPYLDIGNSAALQTGADIYAIGYPRGIDQLFTDGTITNAAHMLDGVSVILNNAQISPGSSGGALVDTKGQVIGVTSGSYIDTQNVNYAMPIHLIQSLKQTNFVPLSTIAAQTPKLTITSSLSTIAVAVGAQTSITITVSSQDFDSIAFAREDISMISCSWGEWNGNSIPLMITGLKAGSTVLYIGLLDVNDNILAETSLNVTVAGGGSTTTYYPGHFPVPDWGAFTGTPLYTSLPHSDGSIAYLYLLSAVGAPSSVSVGGYVDLLESNGFYYYTSVTDSTGLPILVYRYQNQLVYFGVTNISGTYYMEVLIIPI